MKKSLTIAILLSSLSFSVFARRAYKKNIKYPGSHTSTTFNAPSSSFSGTSVATPQDKLCASRHLMDLDKNGLITGDDLLTLRGLKQLKPSALLKVRTKFNSISDLATIAQGLDFNANGRVDQDDEALFRGYVMKYISCD